MSYSQFKKDLINSYQYEIEAQKRLCDFTDSVVIEECKTSDYDFQTENGLTYEVKSDKVSLHTRNFFIEYCGYNKYSGISITKSNYYIITNTLDYYLIATEKLKLLVKNCPIKKVNGGSTYGYLLKKSILVKNSQQI